VRAKNVARSRQRFVEYLQDFVKEVPYERVQSRYEEAVTRANSLMEWQVQQGRPDGNPSTTVHKLTERIADLGRERFLSQKYV